MAEFADSLQFGLAVMMMVLALIGAVLPIVPGSVLMLVTLWGYAYFDGLQAPGPWTVAGLSLLLMVTGTSEWWLPYFGVRSAGGSLRATVYGLIGGVIGLFFGLLFGSLIGYALGVLLGSYQTHRDWRLAFKASMTGIAGQGAATLVELAGCLLVLYIFVRAVLGAG